MVLELITLEGEYVANNTPYNFPFGEPVQTVEQTDRTPKQIFVLGVYASAVHARWLDTNGKQVITALAVASEPYIFWHGNNAAQIIQQIQIPTALGKLAPAASNLNGPSGKVLDDLFLAPLTLSRDDAWLCDLVPHSCLNPNQAKAIDRAYTPLMQQHQLPAVTLPPVPSVLADTARRQAILDEIMLSEAKTIMLLGDEPIKWFLNHFDNRYKRLADFGESPATYGRLHPVTLDERDFHILPLVHPRQAGRLGTHSANWSSLHQHWISDVAQGLNLP
jgi:uracil-DNA glycosylase